MRYLQLPKTTLTVSALCYGTGVFGTGLTGEALDRIMAVYREAGGNFFDTAHCYGFWGDGGIGGSEKALGDWLRRFGGRDELVIGTKGGHPSVPPQYTRPDAYLSPEVISSDVAQSLGHLGIDTIDLYWLHRDDTRVPVGEIMETLNIEVTKQHMRYLGASNWSIARIAEANAYADTHGLRGFVAAQPEWNLGERNFPLEDPTLHRMSMEDEVWHSEQQFPVICYSATACGYFATGGTAAQQAYENPTSRARLQRVEELSATLGRSTNQIALAYLMNQDFPVVPITGTTKPNHLADALDAVSLTLTAAQLRWLRDGL